jgi:hypothetical protein
VLNYHYRGIKPRAQKKESGALTPDSFNQIFLAKENLLMNTIVAQQLAAVKPQISAWLVADPEGVDLAARWGHEDATEGKRRGGDMFTFLSPEYQSYHGAYNAGLRLLHQLTGTVSQGALDECAWFEEIAGATPVPVTRLTAEQMAEIDAETPGLYEYTTRGAW